MILMIFLFFEDLRPGILINIIHIKNGVILNNIKEERRACSNDRVGHTPCVVCGLYLCLSWCLFSFLCVCGLGFFFEFVFVV